MAGEKNQPNKPKSSGDAGAEGESSRKRLSARQSEVLALLSTVQVVVPGRSRLTQTLESLARRGLVERFEAGGGSVEIYYQLAGGEADDVRPRATGRRGQIGWAAAAGPDRLPMASPEADIQQGDVVIVKKLFKGMDVEGCVRDKLPDGSCWICVSILGPMYPVKAVRSRLTLVGRGTKPCACKPPG